LFRRLSIISITPSEYSILYFFLSGKITFEFYIFEKRVFLFLLKKGVSPISISYMIIPRAHQSADLSCPVSEIISGARYSGVPQNVFAYCLSSSIFASP